MRQYKILSEIEDLEDFSKYSIDTEGNLWSLKYKQPKGYPTSIYIYYSHMIETQKFWSRTIPSLLFFVIILLISANTKM